MANKNSLYIKSLVDFIRDTKPFHCKLTEVNEIYSFSEQMNVHFAERTLTSVMTKAVWPYSYFSSGPIESIIPTLPVHRVVTPQFRGLSRNSDTTINRGAFKVGRDENTDLPLVPLAFDPKSIQGTGLADAFVQRNGASNKTEALLEGHDVFLSHGAYSFQIKQVISSQQQVIGKYSEVHFGPFPRIVNLPFSADTLVITGPATVLTDDSITVLGPELVEVTGLSSGAYYAPTFTERRHENVITAATAQLQLNMLDETNPNSSINKIRAMLDLIQTQLDGTPEETAQIHLDAAQAQVNGTPPQFPNSYEELINTLTITAIPLPPGFSGWRGQDISPPYSSRFFEKELMALSPSMFFNAYTDVGQRESAALTYRNVFGALNVTNIVFDVDRADYEEFTITATSATTFTIRGSTSGIIALIDLPEPNEDIRFTSPQISFTLLRDDTITAGHTTKVTPRNKITVHATAAPEGWTLIKVNPIAYSRPVFGSSRYGYIESSEGILNQVDIVDPTFPTSLLTIEAISASFFRITGSSGYTVDVPVGTPFNDGQLAFTIHQGGEVPFEIGDRFFLDIRNDPASSSDADLYFGYDVGPYDDELVRYNTVNSAVQNYLETLEFNYDSRFQNYDIASFGLTVAENAVDARQWRLRALADLTKPLLLQNSTPTNQINELASEDPTNPDAVQQFDMPNDVSTEGNQSGIDPDTAPDILVWYSSSFALEYYDVDALAWVLVDTIQLNTPYENTTHGLSFNVVPASKPFIATQVTSSYIKEYDGEPVVETVAGGDVITFSVQNPDPYQEGPSTLISNGVPRLVMHGDSYHDSVSATWSLTFVNKSSYLLQGVYTAGAFNGSLIFPTPILVSLTNGKSYRNNTYGVHFTIKTGRGVNTGDVFTFETYTNKPSYLVHGTSSGWQPDATVGEYYWNGKIGFKIAEPVATLFYQDVALEGTSTWTLDNPIPTTGNIQLSRLRFDTPNAVYTIKSVNNGHWMLYRDGALVGHGDDVLKDQYVTLLMPTAVAGTTLILRIKGDGHELSIGHDLGIVRTTPGRTPSTDDFVMFVRSEHDDVHIVITPRDQDHAASIAPLAPVSTDLRFIDHHTTSGVELGFTSPETRLLQGWIPATKQFLDTALSNAEFSDPATHVVITAAATGELLGTIDPAGENANEVLFRWDTAFHNKYLPLNTEATVVTFGSGMDDRVQVNMTEGVYFLMSGAREPNDAIFADVLNVGIIEGNFFSIKSSYENEFSVTIQDGPFAGFLPGYDNLPYDFEVGDGNVNDEEGGGAAYDTGAALTEYYEVAQALTKIQNRTAAQERTLEVAVGLINPYLVDGDLASTTLEEFLALMDADPYKGVVGNYSFGVPALGHGIHIEDRPTVTAGTNIVEAMVINSNDFGYSYDHGGYDTGPMDEVPELTAFVVTSADALLPFSSLPTGSYEDYQTDLWIQKPARLFELSFNESVGTPNAYVWRPADSAPRRVPIVERLGINRFKFAISLASEIKLILLESQTELPPLPPAPPPVVVIPPSGGSTVVPQITSFTATPPTSTTGTVRTLSWTSQDGTSAFINHGVGVVPVNGTIQVAPADTRVYQLVVSNAVGSDLRLLTTTVDTIATPAPTVPIPVITSFAPKSGGSAPGTLRLINWSTEDGVTGTIVVTPITTTNYQLTITNSVGSDTEVTSITVAQPETGTAAPLIVSFEAIPANGAPGTTRAVKWQTADGVDGTMLVAPFTSTDYQIIVSNTIGSDTEVTTTTVIEPPIGSVPPNILSFSTQPESDVPGATRTVKWQTVDGVDGTIVVAPNTSTTYQLTISNNAGQDIEIATALVTATVPMPIITSFTVAPTVGLGGSLRTLTWVSQNGGTASINNGVGAVATSGSAQVSPTDTRTYQLTVANSSGSVSQVITANVETLPIIDGFTINTPSATVGTPRVLAWTTTGATTVTLDEGIGAVSIDGVRNVDPTTTTIYTLTASNSVGSVTADITAIVEAVIDPSQVNMVWDGNSFVDNNSTLMSKVDAAAPFNGNATWVTFGASGQTIADMMANPTDVDNAYVQGKTNYLMIWEVVNDVVMGGRTGLATIGLMTSYIRARKALHPWVVVVIGTIPIGAAGGSWSIEAADAHMREFDTYAAVNFRLMGADAFVPLRTGPFAFTDVANQSNYNSTYWTDNVFLNNTGTTIVAGYISEVLSNMPAVIPVVPEAIEGAVLAAEGQPFTLTQVATVAYGTADVRVDTTLPPGTYICGDFVLGDPAFGQVKTCYIFDTNSPIDVPTIVSPAQIVGSTITFVPPAITIPTQIVASTVTYVP